MKHLNSLAMAAAALIVCAAAAGKTPDKENETAKKAMETRCATIEVKYLYPLKGPSIPTSDGYTISLKDGRLNGHLPFIGESHSAAGYGSNDAGFTFEDCPVTISGKVSKHRHEWKFDAVSGNENVKVTVTVWDNGNADIMIIPAGRSIMRYSGELIE